MVMKLKLLQLILCSNLFRSCYAHWYIRRDVADVNDISVVDRISSESEIDCAIKCHKSSKECGSHVLRDHVCILISKETEWCKGDEKIWIKDSPTVYQEAVVIINGYQGASLSSRIDSYPGNLKLPDMTAALKHRGAAAFFDGKIYSCGGSIHGSSHGTKDCNVLGSSGSWLTGPSMNTQRFHFTLTTVGSRLVATGGFTWNGVSGITGSVETLDPNGTWQEIGLSTPSPGRSYHCSAALSETELIISGGMRYSGTVPAPVLDTIIKLNVYDGKLYSWPREDYDSLVDILTYDLENTTGHWITKNYYSRKRPGVVKVPADFRSTASPLEGWTPGDGAGK